MNGVERLLGQRRLILASTTLLSLVGFFAWMTMPREEDPQFPHRDGLVIAFFPGASAETVERLVVEPLEEKLAEVQEVGLTDSTSRAGVAVIHVELRESIYATQPAWDEVRSAVKEAQQDFPEGVLEPIVDDDLVSQEAVILAVKGSGDPLVLLDAAQRIKKQLLAIDNVKKVNFIGDPGEQITVEYDDATARRLGLDPRLLGLQLSQRSAIVPGGLVHLGDKTATLQPETEFRSVEEIRSTPILLSTGSTVPLGEIARVRQGPAEPAQALMRWNGEPVVGLGVIPQDGIDRIVFGKEVRAKLAAIGPSIAPLVIDEVFFQPDLVESRLAELTSSLRQSIAIVLGVLLIFMGLRLGLVVSTVIPLVTFSAVALYAAGGGILHQISIASLVIAMGMLVDNAVVITENVQYRIDRGEKAAAAAVAAVKELAVPLGTSTGTTIAAFLPMLMSKGNTADFTRSIPSLIIIALVLSYFFALLVTPILSAFFLRPQPHDENVDSRAASLGRKIAAVAVNRPWGVIAGATILLLTILWTGQFVKLRFFPAADRNTVVIDLLMPEGTNQEATEKAAVTLEQALLAHDQITSVTTYVGRAGPKFYYNLLSRPNSPQRAQLIAEATSFRAVPALMAWVSELAHERLPAAEVVPRQLEQGPPIDAPIELRVMGADLEAIEAVADQVVSLLRTMPGTRDVRHDLGLGAPAVSFEIDDAAAARQGLARTDVALALLGRTLGTVIGQYRQEDDPIPIVLRSSAGELMPVADLATIDIGKPGGKPVPLEQIAALQVEWQPAAIRHFQGSRLATVQSETLPGFTAHNVFKNLEPRLAELDLPPGVTIALGGELEEAGKANTAILLSAPLGALLLLFFLLVEFNSFRRLLIILVTVPLAVIGVIPGLLLADQPFGFMAILGVIALIGIVVNNAIVLIDVIESQRANGASIAQALEEAILRRTRPILLTSGTTIVGLLPLAITDATLWPPLAWALMSGLAASTLLTLLVVPAVYRLVFRDQPRDAESSSSILAPATAALLVLAIFSQTPARAEKLTLEQAMKIAVERPQAEAAAARARAADQGAIAEHRAAYWPAIGLSVDALYRNELTEIATPIGAFTLGDKESWSLAAQMRQPLWDPAKMKYGSAAARRTAEAAAAQAQRVRQVLAAEAADAFLRVLELDARRAATVAFIESLRARLEEMKVRVAAGRVLEADALKVELGLEAAELELFGLDEGRALALAALARTLGRDSVKLEIDPTLASLPEVEGLDALASAAVAARADAAALRAAINAAELRRQVVGATHLPRLEATLAGVKSDGDPLRPDSLVQGGLALTWTIFAAGTTKPRLAAADAEIAALRAEEQELHRGIRLQLQDATTRIAIAHRAIAVRNRGIELAEETLRVEREKNAAGRATTNDLLAAEAALRQQRTDRDLAEIELRKAWVALELASGG